MTWTFPLFPVPLLIPVFPILVTLQYLPYPFVPLISHNFLLVSTSLVLYLGQLVCLSSGGLVIVFYLIHHICLVVCL